VQFVRREGLEGIKESQIQFTFEPRFSGLPPILIWRPSPFLTGEMTALSWMGQREARDRPAQLYLRIRDNYRYVWR